MNHEDLAKSCPPGLSIAEVIKWLRRRWHKVEYHALSPHARDINNGDCEEFAWAILWALGYEKQCEECLLVPDPYEDPDEFGNDPKTMGFYWPGHFHLQYKGKAYDAECPDGVDCWHDLPLFKGWIRRKKLNLRRTASLPNTLWQSTKKSFCLLLCKVSSLMGMSMA